MPVDPLPIDECAVRAVQIADNEVVVALAADFGMMARDFGVVDLDGVRPIPTDPNGRFCQLKAVSLIGSANDKQGRHGPKFSAWVSLGDWQTVSTARQSAGAGGNP